MPENLDLADLSADTAAPLGPESLLEISLSLARLPAQTKSLIKGKHTIFYSWQIPTRGNLARWKEKKMIASSCRNKDLSE